ncbi:hypothetical protein Cgig2_013445 [Carnegiea gigantea]|uniref:Uncharacterized protein n=1 Tax=Carnegiea gigantea TaxID=171969 RepID=A0A9Q1GHJ7_9CARY|nr:hypothetical protein Cgig2_013445 [Carnegiea gigantea]
MDKTWIKASVTSESYKVVNLVDQPSWFADCQWEKLKSNIRSKKAKANAFVLCMVYVEHMLHEKARNLVANKTSELGISKPINSAAKSEIHNVVWKELMKGETPRRPLNYVSNNKTHDDLRGIRKRSSSPVLEAKISFEDSQIKRMENIIKDL